MHSRAVAHNLKDVHHLSFMEFFLFCADKKYSEGSVLAGEERPNFLLCFHVTRNLPPAQASMEK